MTRARLAKGAEFPVTIRSDVELGRAFAQRIRVQLASRLGHAAGWIERVTVRFIDVNGPRGGVDKICRAKVTLGGHAPVVVERRDHSARAAVDGTLKATERAVREIARKRTTVPRRARVRRSPSRRTR